MKKLSLVCIMAVFILCAMNPVFIYPPETGTIVTDDLGRKIEIPERVTSAVTLAPSLTEILYFLDAEELIKAVDCNSNFPGSVSELDKVTNLDMSINYEDLIWLEPDVIFASELTSLEQIRKMEELELNVYYVKNPTDFSELFETIREIGALIGREEEAESLTEELALRTDAVGEILKGCTEKPLVFYELDATDPTKPWTAGKGTFISKIIELSGGQNLGDMGEGEWFQFGLEALVDADPQVILLGDARYGSDAEAVAARTGWDELDAVKNGRLYEFDDDLVSRPGPRLVEGLEVIAELLHPELFN